MDITPDIKNRLLKNRGLSPDQWDITPEGGVIQKTQQEIQPSSGPDLPALPQTTISGAIGSHALASAAPTAAGLGTFAVGSSLLAPETGGLSLLPLVGTLIASGLASYGTSKLQEPLLTDKFKQQLATSGKEHPVASTIGELAPSALAFNPVKGLAALPELAGATKSLVTTVPRNGLASLTSRQQALLSNVAANTVIGGGQDIAQQSMSDEPFDYGRLATTLAGGALLHTPTKAIGQGLFGFHPMPETQLFPNPTLKSREVVAPETTIPQTTIQPQGYRLPDVTKQGELAGFKPGELGPVSAVKTKGWQGPPEAVDIGTFEGEGGRVEPLAKGEVDPLIEEVQRNRVEMEAKREALRLENEKLKAGIANIDKLSVPPETTIPKPEVTRLPGEKFSEDVQEPETKLSSYPENFREQLAKLQEQQGKNRGFPASEKPQEIPGVGPTGLPLRGKINLDTRESAVSQTRGTQATEPHEKAGHGLTEDMLHSSDPKDTEKVLRLFSLHGEKPLENIPKLVKMIHSGNPELVAKAKEIIKQHGGEEPAAISVGRLIGDHNLAQVAGISKKVAIRNWFNNVKDHIATTLGKSQNKDTVARYLKNRYLYDAPYGTRPEFYGTSLEANKTKTPGLVVSQSTSTTSEDTTSPNSGKELHPDTRITVNHPMEVGNGEKTPAYVQVDMHDNSRSTNPEVLRAEGYNIPSSKDILKGHTQSQYKLADVLHNLKIKQKFSEDVPHEVGQKTDKTTALTDKDSGITFNIPHFKSTSHIEQWAKENIKDIPTLDSFVKMAKKTEILLPNEAIDFNTKMNEHFNIPKEDIKNQSLEMEKSGLNKDEGVPEKEKIRLVEKDLKYKPSATKNYTAESVRTGSAIENKLGEVSFQAAKKAAWAQRVNKAGTDNREFDTGTYVLKEIADHEKVPYTSIDNKPDYQELAYAFMHGDEKPLTDKYGSEFADELKQKLLAYNTKNKEYTTEYERKAREQQDVANKKAEELEAFTRPDVERHSEDLPLEDYKKEQDRAYGHWISPEGKMYRVEAGKDSHESGAIKILKGLVKSGKMSQEDYDKLNIPLNSTTEVERALYDRGFARGVHNGPDDYMVNKPGRLLPKMIQALKDYGIEKGSNVSSTQDEFSGPYRSTKIYNKDERHSEDIPSEEHSSFPPSFFKAIAAQNDKVRVIPDAKDVAQALDEAWQTNNFKRAEYVRVPLKDIGDMNLTEEERNRVGKYLTDKTRNKSTITLTEKEQELADYTQKLNRKIGEDLKESNLPVRTAYGDLRERMLGEFYFPETLSDANKEILTKQTGSPEAKAILNELADYAVKESNGKVTKEEALKNYKEYASALGNRNIHDIEFGAARKARGYGVPESLRETDFLKVLTQYGTRIAKDYAHWTKLQSNPTVAAKLALPQIEGGKSRLEGVDDLMAHPDVENALRFWLGDFVSKNTPRTTAFSRAFLGNLLQTGTQVRNTVQLPALISPYGRTFKDVRDFFSALLNPRDSWRKSLEYGARGGTMDFERWHTLDSPDRVATAVNKFSEIMRKGTLRDMMENADRAFTFEVGRRWGLNNLIDAQNGNVEAQKWLDKFGLGIDTKNLDKIGEHELNVIGSNFVDRVQGTGDARGLPLGVFDSQFAPFFALSRWGIEKSNVIWKDVLTPALKGENYTPLITYTLGTLLTGTAIRKLNELMTGKKDYTPSVSEALTEDRKDYLLASFINLMQQGSYAGIVGDTAKTLSDVFIQHEAPKGPISFPAADFLTQTLGQNLADYTSAIENGASPLETSLGLLSNIAKSSVQNYRLINSRILDQDNTDRSNRFRDIRTFKKLEGEDVPRLSSFSGSQLDNKDVQQYKRTSDIGEAATLLPQLIDKAIEKSKGDPYRLKQELDKVKENNYQTMPNLQTAPLAFVRYMSYLEKTQGAAEAQNRLVDFMTQNAVNRAKAQMVP